MSMNRVGATTLSRSSVLVHLVLTVAGIALLSWAAVTVSAAHDSVAIWWPAAGASVAALVTAKREMRPWITVLIVIVSGIGNLLGGRPLVVSLLFGIANAAEAAVASWWITRASTERPGLTSVPDLLRLVTAAVLGAAVIAVGAGLTIAIFVGGLSWTTLLHLFTSHVSAVLVITPLVLHQPMERTAAKPREIALQVLTLVTVFTVAFTTDPRVTALYLVPLPLIWGAMRLSLRWVTVEVSLTLAMVLSLTALGIGPFSAQSLAGLARAGDGLLALQLTLMQAYVVSIFVSILIVGITVSQRVLLLQRVEHSERILRGGLSDALLGTAILRGRDGVLETVEANGVARDLLGLEPGHSSPWDQELDPNVAVLRHALLDVAAHRLRGWREEAQLPDAQGGFRWLDIAASPIAEDVGLLVLQVVDVTARKTAEHELERRAIHDGLTDLPNRTLFIDRLDRALAMAEREHGDVTVLFLDLDDFKRINDTAGHAAGDEVLREVAARLSGAVRIGDTVSRFGGDEFVILLPGADEAVVTSIVARVQFALDSPMAIGNGMYRVTASIGVATNGPGATPEEILQDADTAMYVSKAKGRDRATRFDEEFRERALMRAELVQDFDGAVERGEVLLFAQPIVEFPGGNAIGAEVLVRWQHPVHGLLAPDQWLEIVNRGSVGRDLEHWILAESCRVLAEWSRRWADDCPWLHVNVSTALVTSGHFAEDVGFALNAAAAPAQRLVIELTETDLESTRGSLVQGIEHLRSIGVRVSVDDFGTGFSTLSRLADLPVDELKIDRSFIARMLSDARSGAIVQTVLGLAQSLGLDVVAEGVETAEQARALTDLGCSHAQGYLWGRPAPIHQVTERLALDRAEHRV